MDITRDICDRVGGIVGETRTFVSYSGADKPFVERLGRSFRAVGVNYWVDYREIRVGDSITDQISKGLRDAGNLVVVLSRASVKSRWVSEEINAAYMAMVEGMGVRLCPALIESCDVPVLLRTRRYADFTKDYRLGFRELIEGLIPDYTTRQELNALRREVDLAIARIVQGASKAELWHALSTLDEMLETALRKRYRIAAKEDPECAPAAPDFYAQFQYLESKGLRLKSRIWASLRDFRNQFIHGVPDVDLADNIHPNDDREAVEQRAATAECRAEEALNGLGELAQLMEVLCLN